MGSGLHPSDRNSLTLLFFGMTLLSGWILNELLGAIPYKSIPRTNLLPAIGLGRQFHLAMNFAGFYHYTLQILPGDLSFRTSRHGISNPLYTASIIKLSSVHRTGRLPQFPKIVGPDKVYTFADQVPICAASMPSDWGGL